MKITVIVNTVFLSIIIGSLALAHTSYTGYSSAPGSRGQCASSCHGNSGGSITVDGFPAEYIPGETYEIALGHSGGSAIRQFNASCRIGGGSDNAGLIFSGTNTATYSRNEETNGVHLSSSNQNNATFNWTAPESGTGEVRLYLAGLQGSYSGQNSAISLVSDEQTTGVDEIGDIELPNMIALHGNFPNPFNSSTAISYELSTMADVTIEIFDLLGKKVHTIHSGILKPGFHHVTWDSGSCPSGIYYYTIRAGDTIRNSRMLLLK